MSKFKEVQHKIICRLFKNYLILGVVLTIALFVTQFAVLATVGVKGSEVSEIRTEKEELRLEIDRIRAQIDSAKTLGKIEKDLDVVFQDGAIASKPIEIDQPGALDESTFGILPE